VCRVVPVDVLQVPLGEVVQVRQATLMQTLTPYVHFFIFYYLFYF
jgi:hypothetical protein